jgi:hypothetical protein
MYVRKYMKYKPVNGLRTPVARRLSEVAELWRMFVCTISTEGARHPRVVAKVGGDASGVGFLLA